MIKILLKTHVLDHPQRKEKKRRGAVNQREVEKAINTGMMRTQKTNSSRKKGTNLNRSGLAKVLCGQRPAEEVVRAAAGGLEVIFHAEEEEVAG